MELGIRVGIDSQDGRLAAANEPIDYQGGEGGFSHTTLSGHCKNHHYLATANPFFRLSLVWCNSEKTRSATATGSEPVPQEGVISA
jgi:hypothetical protein